MCGICGIISVKEKVDFNELKAINDALYHRGPDDEGFFIENNIALAMRRLAIIDLLNGKQPISNETNEIVIVFNGEIYNYRQLKEELIIKGHIFKTNSDTETILHLYEEEDLNFVEKLRGMFAIAIWDKKRKRLILARDRAGKKPLFYYYDNNYFVFSSEIDSLLRFKKVKKTINLKAIDSFLNLQYIPAPMTIYNEIKKLEQATLLIYEKGEIKKHRYWEIPDDEINIDFTLAKEEVRKIVEESVKLRLVSDVKVGAFLSGGIDSSIVVAIMAENLKKVSTFSIGFQEENFNELKYARELSKLYDTDHNELIVREKMTETVENLISIYNQPFGDPSALPTYFVSKLTSEHLKVALNGDGGDENFHGYSRYLAMKLIYRLKMLPKFPFKMISGILPFISEGNAPFDKIWRIRKFLKALLKEDINESYISSVFFFDTDEKNQMLSDDFKNILNKDIDFAKKYIFSFLLKPYKKDFLNRITYADFHSYLSECLMTKIDMASMANSLEARSPLLDHKIIEFTQRLPSRYKIKGFKTKYILKEAFKDKLPDSIMNRGKMGFTIPLGLWFRGELKKKFEEYCLSDLAFKRGYFKKNEIKRLWLEHQSYKRDHGYKLWVLLILELWHRKYLADFKI